MLKKYNKILYLFSLITLCLLFLSSGDSYSKPTPLIQKQKDSLASLKNKGSGNKTSPDTISQTKINTVQIDTGKQQINTTIQQIDTSKKIDSVLTQPVPENSLSNTKLFIYILLSLMGMGLFFFIFVMMMFKTFHKTRSTRQSLSLSWSLFFLVSVIWIFIIWGLVAGFWGSAAFTAVLIFLFIISIILTIISIKTR
ncbi:hypothetical protein BH10BAC5_BH10BAC5_06340 [soil metagenome]